jgi:MSHA biogenesis protein MshL
MKSVFTTLAGLMLAASGHAADPGRFDLSVNNAPAAQVFMQIGNGTPYSMLVTPEVAGNVSVTLKNVTVIEALESLRDLLGRLPVEGGNDVC